MLPIVTVQPVSY